ncbi:MAG: aminoglycoside phosphotransferase family protein, partial [Roseiflexaceae bacterium]|nr:aminoglycoside phosphotransferase family protein [Roseiflexaceae bacterium]
TRGIQCFAVKQTIRDARDRAGREDAALRAIARAGGSFAPRALLLDRDSYTQPVVVQTWLDGDTLDRPPMSTAEWQALLDHYCAIHAITPQRAGQDIPQATLNAASGATGNALVEAQLARLPLAERPATLQRLLDRFSTWQPPQWDAPPVALCRVDGNWRNFIARRGGWASVDWENSGWGDPAFEWADLMTHPAYPPDAPWLALVEAYASRTGDTAAPLRIQAYHTIMLVWWALRVARTLYEVPRGLDPRLAARPADWQATAQRQYEDYLARAELQLQAYREIT